MRRIVSILAISAILVLGGLGLSGSASATEISGSQLHSDGEVTTLQQWEYAGTYDSQVDCNIEGLNAVVLGAEDWNCVQQNGFWILYILVT